jgi:hypothetical protein
MTPIKTAASEDVECYEYCYDTTDDDSCIDWVGTGSTSKVIISGLSPGTNYYWQVRAGNSFGTTYTDGDSAAYWAFTTGNPPGTFAKVSPEDGEFGLLSNVTLDWGDSMEAESYEYCYDTTSDNSCTNWVSTDTISQANISGLSIDTTHYWQVRAVNQYGTTYADGYSTEFWTFTVGSLPGANDLVETLLVQSDDKILVGGMFTELRGQTRNYIARLNPDGIILD